MPKITVIVPVYKVEPYIHRCVDSILQQSFQDFDLVLVDDGSPDTCPQICDDHATQDGRIVVIHKQNGGLSDARNAGIDWAMENSDSEWLAFVDSDDYLHPDYLLTLYETAQREAADLVICDFIRVNNQEEIIEKEHSFFDLVTEDKKKLFEILNTGWRIDMAWNKLYAKPIFNHLRFVFGKIHEDEFAIHHVLWNCQKAAIINCGLYYYRIREHSIMTSESPHSRLDNMEALIEQYEFSVQHHLPPRELLVSNAYLSDVMELGHSLDKQDFARYKNLKKKYSGIFLRGDSNRQLKKRFRFYLYRPCRRIAEMYRKANLHLKQRG